MTSTPIHKKHKCSECGAEQNPEDITYEINGLELDELMTFVETLMIITDRVKKHHLHYHNDRSDCCMFVVADLLTDIGLIAPANKATKRDYLERRALREAAETIVQKRKFKKENK
jgi:hypothetical protein